MSKRQIINLFPKAFFEACRCTYLHYMIVTIFHRKITKHNLYQSKYMRIRYKYVQRRLFSLGMLVGATVDSVDINDAAQYVELSSYSKFTVLP